MYPKKDEDMTSCLDDMSSHRSKTKDGVKKCLVRFFQSRLLNEKKGIYTDFINFGIFYR